MTHTSPEPMVGAVYGLRWFNYDPAEGVLRGPAYPQPTLDAINVAVCAYRSHPAPASECKCGFYAYDTSPGWDNQWRASEDSVACVVELSGRIVVAERGLRAEKLRPVAVAEAPEGFGTNYPRVRQFASEEAMLSEFPMSDLERQPKESKGFLAGPGGRWVLSGVITVVAAALLIAGVIPLLGAPYVAVCALAWASTTSTVSPVRLVGVGAATAYLATRMSDLLDYSLGTVPGSWSFAATISNWTPMHPFSAVEEGPLRQVMAYGLVGVVAARLVVGFVRWCRAKSQSRVVDDDSQVTTRAWQVITRRPRIEGDPAVAPPASGDPERRETRGESDG